MDTPEPGSLDLNDLSNFDDGLPNDYFRALRERDPVHWQPETDGSGYWSLTKYDDVKLASRAPDTFSSERGGTNIWDMPEEGLARLRTLMLNMDPPQHVKYRRLVQRGFTPRMVQTLEPRIREAAKQVVDRVVDEREVDFVHALASDLPLVLITELMGVPTEDRSKIFDWSNQMIGFDDPELSGEDGQDRMGASAQMWVYANQIAAQKREQPDETLISKLVNGRVDGDLLTELEFNNFFVLLSVAGNETTRTVTTHGMRLLMEHPEQYQRLQNDLSLLPTAIEEFLRFNPPVFYFRRTAQRDLELRDKKLREGDKVVMWYGSANRDADVFPDAERFDVGRDPNPHLSFGIGEHFCLGANLARMQLHAIFEEILTRLRNIEPAGPVRRMRGNFVDGVKEMRVRYDVA